MSVPIYNMADTWNSITVVYTGIGMNVVDTGHATGSQLINLQVGGVSKFSVDPTGAVVAGGITASGLTASGVVTATGFTTSGGLTASTRVAAGAVTLTYGATIATDASTGNSFIITATNATAFTISNPTNPVDGQRITYTIRNTAGAALGAITWGTAFKMSALTSPATGFSRSIEFRYNAASSLWVQLFQSQADVPN
jgi:hypothetical protein